VSDHAKVVATESGGADAFGRAARADLPPLKSGFVSTGSVEIGEWIQFELTSLEVVADKFSGDADAKVIEIKGQVIENRAKGLIDEGEVTITCKARRLEQFGNAVGVEAEIPGGVITLVRGEDEGKTAGWRWTIDPPLGQGSLEEAGSVA